MYCDDAMIEELNMTFKNPFNPIWYCKYEHALTTVMWLLHDITFFSKDSHSSEELGSSLHKKRVNNHLKIAVVA